MLFKHPHLSNMLAFGLAVATRHLPVTKRGDTTQERVVGMGQGADNLEDFRFMPSALPDFLLCSISHAPMCHTPG
jgi:hypothetical protein